MCIFIFEDRCTVADRWYGEPSLGTGKKIRIAVFATGAAAEEATKYDIFQPTRGHYSFASERCLSKSNNDSFETFSTLLPCAFPRIDCSNLASM